LRRILDSKSDTLSTVLHANCANLLLTFWETVREQQAGDSSYGIGPRPPSVFIVKLLYVKLLHARL